MSDQLLNKLAICAAFSGGLLGTLGFKGFAELGIALGLIRLFAVFGQQASEGEKEGGV